MGKNTTHAAAAPAADPLPVPGRERRPPGGAVWFPRMPIHRRVRFAPFLLMFALSACSPERAADADAPLLALEEPQYALLVDDGADGGQLRTRLTKRGAWHFSLEYPVRLEVSAAGLSPDPTTLRKDDAREFSEDALEFQLALANGTAEAGDRRVKGTLHFGVCMTDQLCQPVSESFEVVVR